VGGQFRPVVQAYVLRPAIQAVDEQSSTATVASAEPAGRFGGQGLYELSEPTSF